MKIDLRFKYSLIFSILFILILWIVKFFEFSLDISFAKYGVYPLKFEKLPGIILMPLIHGDFKHLISNSIPLLIFLTGLFYFYKKHAWLIFSIIYILTGILIWLTARESYHIGASGVVYGLASFHFFTGVLSKRKEFIAISLVIVFFYGSMIWGIFPSTTGENVSWEGHLMGFIVGVLLSLFYYQKIRISKEIIPEEKNIQENFYDFNNINASYEDIEFKYQ